MTWREGSRRGGIRFSRLAVAVPVLVMWVLAIGSVPAAAQGPGPPHLEIDKMGELELGSDGVATPDDVITYTFTLSNVAPAPGDGETGCSQQIFDLAVNDPLVADIDCGGVTAVDKGVPVVCTGSYAITQGDIDAGLVFNQASADGTYECSEGPVATATDEHTEPLGQIAALAFTKTGTLDTGPDRVANPGDVISYELAVTNSGNVTLSDVTVSDPALADLDCPSGIPIATLAPGDSETCTGSTAIEQADIDAGFKENTADVSGDEPADGESTAATSRAAVAQAMVQVMIPQQPSIDLSKAGTADLGADGFADPGDTISYDLVVSNPGNVTLVDVAVNDPLLPTVTCPSGNPIPSLAPGASETCTGGYTITAADITAGTVPNSANASAQDPTLQAVMASDTDTVTVPAPMAPTAGFWWMVALAVGLAGGGALALRRRGAIG